MIRPPRILANGQKRHDVVYTEGGRKRVKTFSRKGDAEVFNTDQERRRQLGPLAGQVLTSKETLAQFVVDTYWPKYAMLNQRPSTRARNRQIWGRHIEPRLGSFKLVEITAAIVDDFREQLAKPEVGLGVDTQLKALYLLQGILGYASGVHQRVPTNVAKEVKKPKQPQTAVPRPLPPEIVEQIRTYMLTRSWASAQRGTGRTVRDLQWWRHRNALIVSMLAYAGLRPVEDRDAVWDDLYGNVLHVDPTKNGGRPRDVDLIAPLAQELAEWRLMCGRPGGKELIIPRTIPGPWTKDDWDNWRGRVYRPAAIAVLGSDAEGHRPYRPYRLRGSFVSLLLWAGEDPAYVCEQAGHTLATLDKHYRGVMRELRGQPHIPAAEAVARARAQRAEHIGNMTVIGGPGR